MKYDRRTREQRKADTSAMIALICFGLMALLIAAALSTNAGGAEEQVTGKLEKSGPAAAPTVLEADVQVTGKLEPSLSYLGEFRITHYCACKKCCGKDENDPRYGITATGTVATEGRTIAVDPEVIPYGSEVAVFYDDGRICRYIAEDCGGAIDGLKVDVFIADHGRARELGVKSGSVYLVNEG